MAEPSKYPVSARAPARACGGHTGSTECGRMGEVRYCWVLGRGSNDAQCTDRLEVDGRGASRDGHVRVGGRLADGGEREQVPALTAAQAQAEASGGTRRATGGTRALLDGGM